MPHEPAEALTPPLIPPRQHVLCRLDELPDGVGKGFPPIGDAFCGFIAIRQGQSVRVYVNACPHIGTPLDWVPDRFMSVDGRHLICATHGAEFRIEDGLCLKGPCLGDQLEPVPVTIDAGRVMIPENAGP